MRWVTTGGLKADRQPRRGGTSRWRDRTEPAGIEASFRLDADSLAGETGSDPMQLLALVDPVNSVDSPVTQLDPAELWRARNADPAADADGCDLPPGGGAAAGNARARRTLALSGVIATGMLTGSLAQPLSGESAGDWTVGGPSATSPNLDGITSSARSASSSGDLLNLLSMSAARPPLASSPTVGRPAGLIRTAQLLEQLAWTQTLQRSSTLLESTRPSASRDAIERAAARTFVSNNQAVLGALDIASTVARRAEADRQAAAERAEAERVVAVAAEQAQIRLVADQAQLAQQAQLEAQRVAAEDTARRAEADRAFEANQAQAWSQPVAAEAPARAPAAPSPQPEAPTLAPAAAPAPADHTAEIENAFFAMINQERLNVGLAPLSFDAGLRASARAQAANIAAAGSLFHQNLQPLLGLGWRTAGENVGYGYNIDGLHTAFVNSPGHYRNMVGASFTSLGVGVVVGADGRIWVGHVFAG